MEYSALTDHALPEKSRIAFGFFDGMHLGHQAVLDRLPGYEAQIPAVLSFEEKSRPVITGEKEKEHFLRASKAGILISMDSETAAGMDAETFVREVLCHKLRAASVVAGENLLFGSDGKGAQELVEFGKKYGFSVELVPVVRLDGEAVSSDAVKSAIRDGDFPKMKKLMGHSHVMTGTIVHGKKEGRQHAMPTANLSVAANIMLPPYGVYASLSRFDGTFYRGLTSIGLRPSADSIPVPTVETWFPNFSRDIYGKEVVLELHEYIRGIMKFPGGLDDVRKQIDRDLVRANESLDRIIRQMRQH